MEIKNTDEEIKTICSDPLWTRKEYSSLQSDVDRAVKAWSQTILSMQQWNLAMIRFYLHPTFKIVGEWNKNLMKKVDTE